MSQYFRDFSDGGIADWTSDRYANNAVWAVTGDELDGGGVNSVEAITWDAVDADADRDKAEIYCEYQTDNTGQTTRAVMIARGNTDSGATGSQYYQLALRNDVCRLVRKVSGSSAFTVQSVAHGMTIAANTWYAGVFRLNGSTIQGKFWPLGDTEPGWQVNTTDTAIAGVGVVGVQRSLNTHGHKWRNFGVGTNGDAAPRSAIVPSTMDVQIGWLEFDAGAPVMPPVHVWDGATWVPATVRHWDGATWTAAAGGRRWNGTAWV